MSRNRVSGLIFLVLMGIFPSLSASQSSTPAPLSAKPPACDQRPFGYGEGQQKKWCGTCNSLYAKTQAPININTSEAMSNGSLPVLDFSGYEPTKLVTSKDAHNLKVPYKDGQGLLSIGGKPFKLVQFHFHRPGEETIDTHRPAMVIHLVHSGVGSGEAVAIAVMVEEGRPEPNTQALVNKLIQYFPRPKGPQEGVEINAADLLPPGSLRSVYYRYTGSLTTPGCDEPVTFYVLKTPVFFSKEQIGAFEKRYRLPNARDIQPTKGRPVEQTITK